MNRLPEGAKIFVAGHRGLAGGAIARALRRSGGYQVLERTRQELDLRDEGAVRTFFDQEKPDAVVLAAAKVGGIHANNTYPVDFLLENLRIQNAVIASAYATGIRQLLFLGSSCIYPKFAPQPIREESLLSGYLEPTNEAYAIAKIAGIKLCQAYRRQFGVNYICAMPTNLYGPGDNYHLQDSHVFAALIRKIHTAKMLGQPSVPVWGTGSPRREFLHCDDLAEACVYLLKNYDAEEIINVGFGADLTIRELAETIKRILGYQGDLAWDTSKPDGTPRKLMDSSRINALGWKPRISLEEGIADAYRWFVENHPAARDPSVP
ncbi:MAG: GDP-L-fucose synthase [Candidatus Methylacidiphilales bacterium]